ncbi:MAG: signal peptidase I [Planctomycetota bacterium]
MTLGRGNQGRDAGTRRRRGAERRDADRRGPAQDGHPARRSTLFAPRWDDRARPRRGRSLPPVLPRPRPTFTQRAVAFSAKSFVMMLLAWALCFNFSEVRGGSMMPGIQDRDRILVDHVSYLFASVERGDVVVLRYPMDPSLDYVKRVVGLPGDRVQIYDGYVWVNGELLEEPYVDPEANDPFSLVDTVVEEDCFFVLGDNRIKSSDSREFGQVPREYLRGKVRVRLWPLMRAGLVD